jgi:ribokinase
VTHAEPGPIVVVGSSNVDHVITCERLPRAGETLLGGRYACFPGGKGANQAVAAARAGARVRFVGAVGDDEGGARMRAVLAREGIELGGLRVVAGAPTGMAAITVSEAGENTIVVAPGANASLTPADLERALFDGATFLLLQGELPPEVNARAADLARHAGARVVLNASPAAAVPATVLRRADVLVVNRGEAAELTGSDGDPQGAAEALRRMGVGTVIVTLGSAGAVLLDRSGARRCPAFPVTAVDATAAGDAFVGALVALLAEGAELGVALRGAAAAGALACTRVGAIPALPSRAEIQLLAAQGAER